MGAWGDEAMTPCLRVNDLLGYEPLHNSAWLNHDMSPCLMVYGLIGYDHLPEGLWLD